MTQQELTLQDDKMRAEITFLATQTARIQQQMKWQMPVYLVSFIGAVIAIVNVFGT